MSNRTCRSSRVRVYLSGNNSSEDIVYCDSYHCEQTDHICNKFYTDTTHWEAVVTVIAIHVQVAWVRVQFPTIRGRVARAWPDVHIATTVVQTRTIDVASSSICYRLQSFLSWRERSAQSHQELYVFGLIDVRHTAYEFVVYIELVTRNKVDN